MRGSPSSGVRSAKLLDTRRGDAYIRAFHFHRIRETQWRAPRAIPPRRTPVSSNAPLRTAYRVDIAAATFRSDPAQGARASVDEIRLLFE
jgi:hypothetical protein